MLRDLLVAYLSSFKTEAELYAPFEALLHAMGYSHVHFLHGPVEFGKDLIGRRDGRQWAFQLKHGDVGLTAWRNEIQGQCLEMFTTEAGHPDFSRRIGLTGVLVLNGRLKAGAMDRSRQFNSTLPRRNRDKFEVWDLDRMAELLEQSLPALGTNSFALRYGYLEHALRIGKAGLAEIDQYTASWWDTVSREPSTLNSVVIEACIASRLLSRCGLALLAPYMLLGAIRVALADAIERRQKISGVVALLARVFREQVFTLAQGCNDHPDGLRGLVLLGGDGNFGVPCRALLLAELTCLAVEFGLDADVQGADSLRKVFEGLRALPVLHRPPSDRYAVSVLLVAKRICDWESSAAASRYLMRVACHCNDFLNQGGLGLASPYAKPDEEMWRYTAPETEACPYERQSDSFVISACLDALKAIGDAQAVSKVLQDTRAVGGIPTRIVPDTGAAALFLTNNNAMNVMLHALHDGVSEAEAQLDTHFLQYPQFQLKSPEFPSSYYWAISALLRDRWHPELLRPQTRKAN